MKIKTFNKAQLLTLNELVQALPMSQRKPYLENLGELWDYLRDSDDYLVDERDYNIYSIVRMGEQAWLGENLRYKGVLHYEHPHNPNLFYGCLYDWSTMMSVETAYNEEEWKGDDDAHQGIAPNGWHIPSDREWKELETFLGMSKQAVEGTSRRAIRFDIKSTTGWYREGNGDNYGGFNVLPTGFYWAGKFNFLGQYANFWSSTNETNTGAWNRQLYYNTSGLDRGRGKKKGGHACRCIQNSFIN